MLANVLQQSYHVEESATNNGKYSHGELKNCQKSANTGVSFEHQLVVVMAREKMTRTGDKGRARRNLLRTMMNLLFVDIRL